jgi:hypothetical protein
MGVLCNLHRDSHAGSLTVASIVIDIPAYEVFKLWSIEAVGMASAAAAGESHGFYLVTTVGSGGSPTTLNFKPENNTQSVPAGFAAKYGYSSEPVLDTNGPLIKLPYQPAGGVGQWPLVSGSPLIVHNKSGAVIQVACRSILGTGNLALNLRCELGV